MQLWTWQKHLTGGKGVWRLFSDKRAKSNDEGWKSSAGEFLMIYPIVLDWVSTHVSKRLPGEIESFRRLCAVIDYIQALKHGIAKDTGSLHVLIEAHLRSHRLVYGNDQWTPSGMRLCTWRDRLSGMVATCSTPSPTKGPIKLVKVSVTQSKPSLISRNMC